MALFVEEFARAYSGEVVHKDENGNELPASFGKKQANRLANDILAGVQAKRATYSALIRENADLAIQNPAFYEYGRLLMDPSPDAKDKNLATLTYLKTKQGQRDVVADALTKLRKIAGASFARMDDSYAEYLSKNYLTYAITPYLSQMVDDLSSRDLLSPEILDLYNEHKDAYENTDALKAISVFTNPAYLKTAATSSSEDARLSYEKQLELIALAGEDGNLVQNIIDFETRQAKIRGMESACVGEHDTEFSPDEFTFTMTQWDKDFKKEGPTRAVDFSDAFGEAGGLRTEGDVRFRIHAERKSEDEVNRIRNVFDNEKNRFVLFDMDKLKEFAKKTFESLDDADFSAFNIFQRSSKQYKDMKASSRNLCDVLEAVSRNENKDSAEVNSEKIINALESFRKANEAYVTYKEADVKQSVNKKNARLKLAKDIMADFNTNGAIKEVFDQNNIIQKYKGFKEAADRIDAENSINKGNGRQKALETIKFFFASKLVDSFRKEGNPKGYTKLDFIKGLENHSEQMDGLLTQITNFMDKNDDGNYSFEKFAQALTNPEDPEYEQSHEMLKNYADDVTKSIKDKFTPKEAKQDDKVASTELGIGGPLV